MCFEEGPLSETSRITYLSFKATVIDEFAGFLIYRTVAIFKYKHFQMANYAHERRCSRLCCLALRLVFKL